MRTLTSAQKNSIIVTSLPSVLILLDLLIVLVLSVSLATERIVLKLMSVFKKSGQCPNLNFHEYIFHKTEIILMWLAL